MKPLISCFVLALFFGSTASAQTVTIGTQVWMTKNLNVSNFRNGDPIPEAKTAQEWKSAGDNHRPAWCYYNNDPTNGAKYGKLYNWYAVNDPRGLAPEGYHIPSKEEWDILNNTTGGVGIKLKSTSGWNSFTTGGYETYKTCPNCKSWNSEYRRKVACHVCKETQKVKGEYKPIETHSGNGTNTFGFSALPGGYKHNQFEEIGSYGYWWSSSFNKSTNWYSEELKYPDEAECFILGVNLLGQASAYFWSINKEDYCSVRCIKNKVSESSVNTQTQNNREFVKSENMESKFKNYLESKNRKMKSFDPKDSTGIDTNDKDYYFNTDKNQFEPIEDEDTSENNKTKFIKQDISDEPKVKQLPYPASINVINQFDSKYPCLKHLPTKTNVDSEGYEYSYKLENPTEDETVYYFLSGICTIKHSDGTSSKKYFNCPSNKDSIEEKNIPVQNNKELNFNGLPFVKTPIKINPNPYRGSQNVFFNKNYTLFDQSRPDEPIYPVNKNGDVVYQIYYSSNEDPTPHYREFTPEQLESFLYYKFKNLETCLEFCNSKKSGW